MPRRLSLRSIPRVVLLPVALAIVTLPAALLAHAHLERSSPSAREALTRAPAEIRLWFSEHPEPAFTRIQLLAVDGTQVRLGQVTAIAGDAKGIVVPVLGAMRDGAYAVVWQTAGADGHPSSGRYQFTLTLAADAALTSRFDSASAPGGHALVRVDTRPAPAPRTFTAPAVRWAELVAIIGVLGAVVIRLVVLRGVEHDARRISHGPALAGAGDAARRFGLASLVLYGLAALTRLADERGVMEAAMGAAGTADLRTLMLSTSWGNGWLVGATGAAIAAIGLLVARRVASGWTVAALGALAIAVGPALTGHASSASPRWLAVVVDAAHVAGAGVWIGALLVLVISVLPALGRSSGSGDAEALARAFHPVALTGATLVVASGLVSTWVRMPSVDALWRTDYGRLLLIKLAFVAVVGALGALNWRRVLPSLGRPDGVRRLRRSAGMELIIAGVVVALTALIVTSPLP